PILHYALENVASAGIREVGIIVRADSDEVQRAIGDGKTWGVAITYIPQEAPLGLAHVIKIARPFLGEDRFLFYLGDNMIVGRVVVEKGARLVRSHVRGPAIIGEDAVIEDSYVGPFSSIGPRTRVSSSEVEHSIVLDRCRIEDVGVRIESSILGTGTEVVRA